MRHFTIFIALVLLLISFPARVVYAEGNDRLTDSGFLWLINPQNPLNSTYEPTELIEYKNHRILPAVRDAFEQMIAAMREDGINSVYIQSAYRSYSRQQYLFNNKTASFRNQGYDKQAAIERTALSLAYPGASEHQAGLAIDVTINGRLSQSFANTEAGRWINENCHKFGFIIRYQKDKTSITRIMYEPWHLRYVGNPHASYMKENNYCLEEYISFLAAVKMYIYWENNREYYLVSYGESYDDITEGNLIDISTDRAGENAIYVYTARRSTLVERN